MRLTKDNAGVVIFMANNVDVTTLVQIFQLLNKDEYDAWRDKI